MIKSFADTRTARIDAGLPGKGIPSDIVKRVRAKLGLIRATTEVEQLRLPPGNRLEALRGDRAGQHSIRVNDQWRICFRWVGDGAEDVELTDYH